MIVCQLMRYSHMIVNLWAILIFFFNFNIVKWWGHLPSHEYKKLFHLCTTIGLTTIVVCCANYGITSPVLLTIIIILSIDAVWSLDMKLTNTLHIFVTLMLLTYMHTSMDIRFTFACSTLAVDRCIMFSLLQFHKPYLFTSIRLSIDAIWFLNNSLRS